MVPEPIVPFFFKRKFAMAGGNEPAQRRKKKKTKELTDLELMCQAREQELGTQIPVGTNVKLEARIANQATGDVAVIFCPALPPAGNMYIPEIGYLQAKLAREGYVTVRINFRGVGTSDSTYFRSARREMEDVRDVARWLQAQRRHFNLPELRSIWIVGVSYGSVIGSAAAHFPEFAGYVAVAYPVNYVWYCTTFDSSTFVDLAKSQKPKLFVWGETDVFAGKSAMDAAFADLPEPKSKHVLTELDPLLGHYFRSKQHLDALVTAVQGFLREHQPPPDPKEVEAAAAAAERAKKKNDVPKAPPPPVPAPAPAPPVKTKKKRFGFF